MKLTLATSQEIIPAQPYDPLPVPEILRRAGSAAIYASEEFFYATIRNENTRAAYMHAVQRFLAWCERHGRDLVRVTPRDVATYLDEMKVNTTIASRKLYLSALRHFFDGMVTRHVIMLNPALSVRGERYQVLTGKTPGITPQQARALLAGINTSRKLGLRNRAIIATLIYTIVRVSAVCKLRRGDFYHADGQWMFLFREKGGKERQIPVRHDLEGFVFAYIDAAGLRDAPKDSPLFRSFDATEKRFTGAALDRRDIHRMMKGLLTASGLPDGLSPHSFRVMGITMLREQGVPLDEVQNLAGHADPRTTRGYDRREQKVTRNLVERISI